VSHKPGAGPARAVGRPSGRSRTRGAILAAARRLFASQGAAGTTIRSVAEAAGVDPALVLHYFESKDGLFQAAIEWPVDMKAAADRVFAEGPERVGERLVRFFMEQWENESTRHPLEIIFRTAIGRQSEGRLWTEFVHDQLIGRLAAVVPGPDAELRGSLVFSSLGGLALGRYILKIPPLATLDPEDVVALVGPTVQRYVNGDLAVTGVKKGQREKRPGAPPVAFEAGRPLGP
jgi:AcrR family transcriptional regulator